MKKLFFCFVLTPFVFFGQSEIKIIKQLLTNKQFVKAEELATNYLLKDSKNRVVIELLGDAFGYQKKWNEAIKHYKLLKEADANNANYHYKYGGALGMKALNINKLKALGLIGDVKRAFLKAAELDPNHLDTRWALVELYMQLPGLIGGSKKKSFKYANELEKLSKVDGYLAKGYIYEYDDEPELAEKYYKMAIKVDGSVTCFEKPNNLYETPKLQKKAITTIETSHKKHQRNAMHYQIGKVCAEYNIQLEKGEKCLLNYINNYSAADGVPKSWAYYRLAQIQKHKNNKNEALNWITKAINEKALKIFQEEKRKILKL